jgi:hypothetical protein
MVAIQEAYLLLVIVAIYKTSGQAITLPRDLVSFGDSPFKKELLTLKVSELVHGGNTGDELTLGYSGNI